MTFSVADAIAAPLSASVTVPPTATAVATAMSLPAYAPAVVASTSVVADEATVTVSPAGRYRSYLPGSPRSTNEPSAAVLPSKAKVHVVPLAGAHNTDGVRFGTP